jgi:hypothetical protein
LSQEKSGKALARPQQSNNSTRDSGRQLAEKSVGGAPKEGGANAESLDAVGAVKYGEKRWTLGSSATLVDGSAAEPGWVTIAWIAVPAAIALGVLAFMLGLGGAL